MKENHQKHNFNSSIMKTVHKLDVDITLIKIKRQFNRSKLKKITEKKITWQVVILR